MTQDEHTRTLTHLVEAYLESLRPQVHEILVEYNRKVVEAYEVALGVRVPSDAADGPARQRALHMLFHSTTRSALAARAPLDGYLEAGLIFSQLAAAGELGSEVEAGLVELVSLRKRTVKVHMDVMVALVRILNGNANPTTTMEAVRATGLYPSLPEDFDPLDYQ
ncbi:MAG: hypothetical protein HOW73_48910 [Polyangiaceae bacterium]|nr:hypothetical protein [Polyangiaceae bacterium]